MSFAPVAWANQNSTAREPRQGQNWQYIWQATGHSLAIKILDFGSKKSLT
jgi:hypothetical protein